MQLLSMKDPTKIELFYSNDNFRCIAQWVLAFKSENHDVLGCKYKIEKLCVRRKRSLLRLMYIASKDSNNIKEVTHNMNLRSSDKIKLKEAFSDKTKLHKSPYFRGLKLWSSLPVDVQKAESIEVFKLGVKKNII